MIKFARIAIFATSSAIALVPIALLAADPTAASSSVSVTTGKMLYGPDGHRIGSVYRVTAQGDAQLILDGKIVTAPASTLSEVNGKITTSLTKSALLNAH